MSEMVFIVAAVVFFVVGMTVIWLESRRMDGAIRDAREIVTQLSQFNQGRANPAPEPEVDKK